MAHARTFFVRTFLGLAVASVFACTGGNEADPVTPSGDGDGDVGDGDGDVGDGDVGDGDVGDGDAGDGDTTASGGATGDGDGAGGTQTSGTGGAAGDDLAACDDAGLTWKTARKTNYVSYPEPDSEECIEYNGCMWAGYFAGCEGQQTEEWVAANNIAAVFPGFDDLAHHRLCIKSGEQRMIVHVVDTCSDSDCDGCCTENQANNDALIDLESYTNARWGLSDGIIEWADLGPASPVCP